MGTVVLGSGTAVAPSAGDQTFAQMKTDVAMYYGLEHDPGKVELAGRAIRGIIDELNMKQLWDFNIITSAPINTVNGTADYSVPGDFWKVYNARKTSDIDYSLTVLRRSILDTQFQSQANINGFPYTLVITNTFRDVNVKLFPTPDAVYTFVIRYYKLIGRPANDNAVLDLPMPYQVVPFYGALARFGMLNDRPDMAAHWQQLYMNAYQDMKRSDADLGDEDLRFINIEEALSRSINFVNPAARPRAYDLF